MEKDVLAYRVLFEEGNSNVNQLFDVYGKNPYNARVIFMNSSKELYKTRKLVLFEQGKTFNIVLFQKTFGISKTNRIYSRESRCSNISYKNGKFYLIYNKTVRPLTYNNLCSAFDRYVSEVVKYLTEKFTWLRYIQEKNILLNTAFNTIISKKLYSYKKAITHQYNIPYPIGKTLHELYLTSYDNEIQSLLRNFKINLEYLENVTSLDIELIKNNKMLFVDTLRMSRILGHKFNCKWKIGRLKQVHDEWAKEITNITYIDSDREMKINTIFKSFAEYSGFKLLTTTKEMYLEGKQNNHCVATYVNKVESLTSGIYHINGYTLEIRKDWGAKHITYSQFRGYSNSSAPTELRVMVEDKIKQFNIDVLKLTPKEITQIEEGIYQGEFLPF